MERVFLIGEWGGSVYQKWAYKYLSNNLWRVQHRIGDLQDLMQEAAMEFILVRNDPKIMTKINSPAQFMSYYQRSLASHVNNISMKDSRNRATLKKIKNAYTPQEQRDTLEEREFAFDRAALYSVIQSPIVQPDAELNIILNESSNELKEVLKIFFNAPVEVMETLRAECKSYSPLQFFNRVLKYCGIPQEKSKELIKELEDRLS